MRPITSHHLASCLVVTLIIDNSTDIPRGDYYSFQPCGLGGRCPGRNDVDTIAEDAVIQGYAVIRKRNDACRGVDAVSVHSSLLQFVHLDVTPDS